MALGSSRKKSYYFLSVFFAAFLIFLYGPMFGIILLSFQGPDGGYEKGSEDWFLDRHHSLEGRGFPYRLFQQLWKSGQWLPAVSIKPLHPSGAFPKMIQ